MDFHCNSLGRLLELDVLHFEHCFVCCVDARFVKHFDTERFIRTVWLRHFEVRVDLTNIRHVLRHERPKQSLQFDALRPVASDVLEEFSDFVADFETGVVSGVVRSWNVVAVVLHIVYISIVDIIIVARVNLRLKRCCQTRTCASSSVLIYSESSSSNSMSWGWFWLYFSSV